MLKKLESIVIQAILVECIVGVASLILLHSTNLPFQALTGILVMWTLVWLAFTIWRMGNIKEE